MTLVFHGENPSQRGTAESGSWKRMDFEPGTTCPGIQISPRMCQTTPQALEMGLGGNSLHMGISQERTLLPSLVQFIPVSPKSTSAKHLTGDDQLFARSTAYLLSRTGKDLL